MKYHLNVTHDQNLIVYENKIFKAIKNINGADCLDCDFRNTECMGRYCTPKSRNDKTHIYWEELDLNSAQELLKLAITLKK